MNSDLPWDKLVFGVLILLDEDVLVFLHNVILGVKEQIGRCDLHCFTDFLHLEGTERGTGKYSHHYNGHIYM